MTGLSIPDTVEGKSLMPIIEKPKATIWDTLHFAYKGVQRAVRDDRYKLIEYMVNGQRTNQLFDLVDDPYEINNLAGDPDHSSKLKYLRGELLRWKNELDDTQEMGQEFWKL